MATVDFSLTKTGVCHKRQTKWQLLFLFVSYFQHILNFIKCWVLPAKFKLKHMKILSNAPFTPTENNNVTVLSIIMHSDLQIPLNLIFFLLNCRIVNLATAEKCIPVPIEVYYRDITENLEENMPCEMHITYSNKSVTQITFTEK